jgi:aryl-alcohol dehydrogenase-like predicted oxidoreductase
MRPFALPFELHPWGLLQGGELTGKYLRQPDGPNRSSADAVTQRVNQLAKDVAAVADEIGRSNAEVAINWVRQQEPGCGVVPILGARSAEQLRANLGCLEFGSSQTTSTGWQPPAASSSASHGPFWRATTSAA